MPQRLVPASLALTDGLVTWVFPALDTSYPAQGACGATDLETVGGIGAIVVWRARRCWAR